MINLYYHGGSANHGCEAIVRSTAKILNVPVRLFTTSPEEDIRYGLKQVVDIIEDKEQKVPNEALNLASLLGIDEEFIEKARELIK